MRASEGGESRVSSARTTEREREGEGTHLLLDRELDAETLAMRLGPDEAGVDEADLCEALELAQADGEELARLELGAGPGGRGRQPALAAAAERDGRLLGNAVGDVDAARWARDQGGAGSAGRLSHVEREGGRGDARVAQAVDAEVGAVRLDRRAAVCCAGTRSALNRAGDETASSRQGGRGTDLRRGRRQSVPRDRRRRHQRSWLRWWTGCGGAR